MTWARSCSRLLPALLLAVALTSLAGCSSNRSGRDCGCPAAACMPSGCGALPTDLPRDPDPCVKYCKVWVPPVYRDVPRLTSTPGCMVTTNKTIMETHFVERMTKPAQGYHVSMDPGSCEQTAVEVCAGGYAWQDVGCGCMKYCYTPPKYTWCTKRVKGERISYCNEEPAEYETVAYTCPKNVCGSAYVPPKYRTVWEKECYTPGHYEWVAKSDPCGTCAPAPCNPKVYPVGGCNKVDGCIKLSSGGCTPSCARCN